MNTKCNSLVTGTALDEILQKTKSITLDQNPPWNLSTAEKLL